MAHDYYNYYCYNYGKINKLNLLPRKIPIQLLKQILERIYDSCHILNTLLLRRVQREKLMISKLLMYVCAYFPRVHIASTVNLLQITSDNKIHHICIFA